MSIKNCISPLEKILDTLLLVMLVGNNDDGKKPRKTSNENKSPSDCHVFVR